VIDAPPLRDWLERAIACRPARRLELEGHGRAAILVPLLDTAEGPSLLFTVRAAHLRRHAGQIAFPGGRVDPGEADLDAALREAREEVGLDVRPDAVCGRLDDHPSPFGLIASPHVARVAWPAPLVLQVSEVVETFVVPLATLQRLVPTVERRETPWGTRLLHGYEVAGRRIWGLTGNVVKDLLDRLASTEVPA
jgi:8-oxo-dGTP pyrophosphatase MutT (NUDIX family)